VAIGLQLNSRRKEIRLTVAENKKVMGGLVNHLTMVWRKLHSLSCEYERNRNKGGRWDKSQPRSPPMPPEVGLALRIEIFRDIYLYSLKKQMKRIDKWFKPLGHFMKKLLKRRPFPTLQGFELSLYNAAASLMIALELVSKLCGKPSVQLTESEWELVYFQSILAHEEVGIVLADRKGVGCDALAEELKDHPSQDPFPLRRALEKLTSLPRHIETLFGFAHSPRLLPALRYRLFISAVPEITRTVKLPASSEGWKSFLVAARGKRHDFKKTPAVELAERFGPRQWVCPVHCECGLIMYLHTRQGDAWDHVPAFSYIGVSKLSCSACSIWIEAFNERSGREFYTRGSHGKWYWPWGIPRAEGPSAELMVQKILDKYFDLAIQKLERSGSDSSGASSAGAKHVLSDDQRNNAKAAVVARAQAHGGPGFGLFDAKFPDA